MQTAGLDVPLSKRFVFGATFERGEVTPSGTPLAGSPPLARIAGTAYASYAGDALRVQFKAELRQDTAAAGRPAASTSEAAVARAGHVHLARGTRT